MRVKKQKRHRRVVRFFTACFGFREPFKILCDGTFIHHLLLHGLVPADDAISRLLGGRTMLFSTTCVNGELRSLGSSHSDALQAAQDLITARCDHEKRTNATACIQGVVAKGNPEHFFVATQDAELRKILREIPGIPVIYALKNSLFLDKPSSKQREFVKSAEEKRLHMSEMEAQIVHKKRLKEMLPKQEGLSEGFNKVVSTEAIQEPKAQRKNVDVLDKCQFKRKRPKGPNPLSCKKKKTKENSQVVHTKNGELKNGTKRKRSRKRRNTQSGSEHGDTGN